MLSISSIILINSEIYGHNNRKGILAEVKAFFPKGNFELGLRYVYSSTVRRPVVGASEFADWHNSILMFVGSRYQAL